VPIGQYANFAECVAAQKSKGKDDNSASKICGFLEKQSKGADKSEVIEQDGKLFLRAFLLDSSVNLNGWGVSKDTLKRNLQTYIGKPLVVQEDFGHPQSEDPNYDHQLQYQESFRIGNINAIVENNGIYSAIIEVTDPQAKDAFRLGNLPLYVSPQLFHDGIATEPEDNMVNWRGTHLAIVDQPAFGAVKARVTGQCNGDITTCTAQLKRASCKFCIKKTIQNYVSNYKNSSLSSLFSSENNNNSKLNDKEETNKTVSIEEHEKLKQALDEIKKERDELKSLSSEKDNVISGLKEQNENITNRVASIEKEIRTKDVANILSAMTFKTDEDRSKRLETLVNSNLTIDSIKETYEPLVSASQVKSAKTSLPQKSVANNEEQESAFIALRYGGSS